MLRNVRGIIDCRLFCVESEVYGLIQFLELFHIIDLWTDWGHSWIWITISYLADNKLGFMLYVSVWTESLKLYSINVCVCGESLKLCNINVRMCVLKAWNCVRACICVFKSCKLHNINKCFESLRLYNIKGCVCVLKAGSFII